MSTMQLHSDDFEVCLYADVEAMLSEARERVAKEVCAAQTFDPYEGMSEGTKEYFRKRADRILAVIKEAL
jgi:hypothetical protein